MSDAAVTRQLVALSRLSQLELDIRAADASAAIAYIAVNDTHRVVPYDYALVWLAREAAVAAVSGGLKVDPRAPQIAWFDAVARHLARTADTVDPVAITPALLPAALHEGMSRWLAGNALWVPLAAPSQSLRGGLVLQRSMPLTEPELRILARLASAYGSALAAVAGNRQRLPPRLMRAAWFATAVVALIAALASLPLHLVVLADAKVVPATPTIVAAPLDGVVERLTVAPNAAVAPGQLLLRYDRTELAAAEQVAAKRVGTLSADRRRAEAQGFRDPKARAEIGALMSRLAEGEAELEHARERLARTLVVSDAAGIVLLDDPLVWEGRPVRTGERILAIADPRRVRLEIYLPTEDAIVAEPGAAVELFLASAPASPIRARLFRISHEARALPNQSMAFLAEAEFDAGQEPPRLGLTGTAKIYGERAALAYLVLRKPLAAIRRLIGL